MKSTERSQPDPRVVGAGEDWWAIGELFSLTVDRVTAPIEGMHSAIADRWFGIAGSSGEAAKRGYNTITKTIYGSVRFAASAMGALLPFLINRQRAERGSRVGSGLRATANALWGDDLESRNSGLATEMGFRDSEGRSADLASISPNGTANAGGRLVVLIHGLGQTERCWLASSEESSHLVDMLKEGSFTPVLLRYNTGRHVAANGEDLAEMLEEVVAAWPVEITEVALVGHSMGGLVARSALGAGIDAGHRWATKTRHLITLGTPHLGSPLEKGANLLAWGLSFTPESRPLGEFLSGRSAGIKDLRFGSTRRAELSRVDPRQLLSDAVGDVAPPDGVEQHFIAGVVTTSSTHPVGAMVGDMVVRVGSATGQGSRRRVNATDVLIVGRQRHFDLPSDTAVHEQILTWLRG